MDLSRCPPSSSLVQSSSTVPLQFLGEVQGFRPVQAQAVTAVIALGQLAMLPALGLGA